MRKLFVIALAAGLLAGCSSHPSRADEEFVEGVDTMREIAAADCKDLRKLEDRFLLKSDDPSADQVSDAATYLPVIRDRMAELHCK